MVRQTTLLRTPSVLLARYDHPANRPHRDPPEEKAPAWFVSFVESGRFEIAEGRRRWQLGPGSVFLSPRGAPYRCRHFEATPADVCFSVGYTGSFVEDLQRTISLPSGRRIQVFPLTNRLAYIRLGLMQSGTAGSDALAAETRAGELLASIVAHAGGNGGRLFRARQLAWYAERVEAARRRLETQYAEPHSLTSLARAVGMSPFHFARVFRELTGTPPHRYLLRVRLRCAAERLRAGMSVTAACFDSGFNHLSHFIHRFHRTFGVTPSQFVRRK
ncbi:MAG: AraC family transcriptional regulator [Terriglobia bacterium]